LNDVVLFTSFVICADDTAAILLGGDVDIDEEVDVFSDNSCSITNRESCN
jgi:hypothetical protein